MIDIQIALRAECESDGGFYPSLTLPARDQSWMLLISLIPKGMIDMIDIQKSFTTDFANRHQLVLGSTQHGLRRSSLYKVVSPPLIFR